MKKQDLMVEGMLVHVVPMKQAKKLRLAYRAQEGAFRLSVPMWISQQDALFFVRSHASWMREQMQKQPAVKIAYLQGEQHMVMGKRVILGEDQVPVGQRFVAWRLQKLEDYVKRILPEWAETMQVRILHVTFRETRTIWGSCRAQSQRITLNSRLALYPEECTEMVVIHELNHMHHPDHSKAFYADMDRYMPDWRRWDQILKTLDVRPRIAQEMEERGLE